MRIALVVRFVLLTNWEKFKGIGNYDYEKYVKQRRSKKNSQLNKKCSIENINIPNSNDYVNVLSDFLQIVLHRDGIYRVLVN